MKTKLAFLLLVIIAFLGSFSLGFRVRAKELGINLPEIGNASDLPVLMGTKNFPILSGQGIIAIDEDSNVTLFEKNPDKKLLPASTTKILTALVSLDYYRLDDILTVSDVNVEGQKMGLVKG
jgi:D-alanyl-D-alanine carboxypeptidase (penicillin-binding protein 5/6)